MAKSEMNSAFRNSFFLTSYEMGSFAIWIRQFLQSPFAGFPGTLTNDALCEVYFRIRA